MAEYDTYENEIADEIARVIGANLASPLGLLKCETGDLSEFPAPEEFRTTMNCVLVRRHGGELVDMEVGSPAAARPEPRGFDVQYVHEVVFIRLDQANEDSHAEVAAGARAIVKLFLNGQRKLPGLSIPGLRVRRATPVSWTAQNPYNELYDVPEVGAKAVVIWLHVYTRSLLA